MGTIFSVIGVGNLWSPFLGGWLYRRAGMHGVMAVAISLLAADLVLRLLVVEKKTAREADDIHNGSDGQPNGHKDNCVGREASHEEQPLLGAGRGSDEDLKLSDKQPPIAILMGSFDATIATVSHQLFGFDSFQAGMLFLPIGIMHMVCGPIIGWVVDRYGTKIAAVFAFGILVPVLVLLRLVHAGGVEQVVLYAVLLCFAGIGVAGAGTPSIVEAGALIDRYHKANPEFFGEKGPYAMVYGMNGMVFNAGLTIGPTLAGEVKQAIGYGNMNLVLAVVSGVTALLCFLYLGGKPRSGKWQGIEPGQAREQIVRQDSTAN
ncbi:hypothetical protein LTR85_012213 [Meristemomyces frigidus]|nr:hypothetical protein LTR85_012213 [Meristemomyces frigidus]